MIARIRTLAGLFWFISCPVHSWDVSMPWAQNQAGACSRSAERGLSNLRQDLVMHRVVVLAVRASFRSNWASQLGSASAARTMNRSMR